MNTKIQHLFGGLFGAVIGIIIAGFFENQGLLLLAFPGAILGYHVRSLKSIFKDNFEFILNLWKTVSIKTTKFMNKPFTLSKIIYVHSQESIGFFISLISTCFLFITSVIIWFFSRPKCFLNWLREHPINRANFLSGTVCFLYVFGAIGLIYLLSQYCLSDTYECSRSIGPRMNQTEILIVDTGVIHYLLFTIICGVVLIAFPLMSFIDKKETMLRNRGWSTYKRYKRDGVLAWIYSDIKDLFIIQISYLYVVIIGISYFTIIGGGIILFLFIPAGVAFAVGYGIYQTAVKKGGWTCATITTIVTLISGIVFWDTIISNFTLRWLIALFTGALAGTLSLLFSELTTKLSTIKIVQEMIKKDCDMFGGIWLITKKPACFFPEGLNFILKPVELYL
ncbi:hypothetical protein KKH36_00280 [Patescibacteria group bacterium]|nr:hypothetical protein [Patescibacteria group bacterium]